MRLQAVEKPLTGFSDKFLQSAARTPCSPTANNSHTCSLRSIFCQVHAPTENDLILFGGLRRQTLRGFFDKLRPPPGGLAGITAIAQPERMAHYEGF